MRTLEESRDEFNSSMNPYTAIIVQSENKSFSDDFFARSGLQTPSKRLPYTPPGFVGTTYVPYFILAYKENREPSVKREEKIPYINPEENFLICDGIVELGETFELAMVRLVEKGADINKIWCISGENLQSGLCVELDTGAEWHAYRKRQGEKRETNRTTLTNLGFNFPSLEI